MTNSTKENIAEETPAEEEAPVEAAEAAEETPAEKPLLR